MSEVLDTIGSMDTAGALVAGVASALWPVRLLCDFALRVADWLT